MLTKPHLIDAVIEVNPTARREWLAQFATEDVRDYLDRLRFAAEPRGAQSVWSRRSTDGNELESFERVAA